MVGFYLGRDVYLGSGFQWIWSPWLSLFLMKLLFILRTLPMFWWYLGTSSDRKEFRLNLRFVGFVVLYLCFGGTWVPVVLESDLLWLVYVWDLWPFTCVLVVPRYMLQPKRDLFKLICVCGGFLQFTCVYMVLGYLFLLKTDCRVFFGKFCCFGDLWLGLII